MSKKLLDTVEIWRDPDGTYAATWSTGATWDHPNLDSLGVEIQHWLADVFCWPEGRAFPAGHGRRDREDGRMSDLEQSIREAVRAIGYYRGLTEDQAVERVLSAVRSQPVTDERLADDIATVRLGLAHPWRVGLMDRLAALDRIKAHIQVSSQSHRQPETSDLQGENGG